MVKFKEVDPNEIKNVRSGRRGRVSYPIIKGFMETGIYVAEVDLTEVGRDASYMNTLLKSYVKNNNLPVKPLTRSGRLYLMRLDIDEDGEKVEDWEDKADPVKKVAHTRDNSTPLTAEVIEGYDN